MNNERQSDFGERVRLNQEDLAQNLSKTFDYIVCGAGTSGCTVAARLAANPDVQVLLLEAGGSDELDLITDPNKWPMTLGSSLEWGFVARTNSYLNGRAIPYSMGKVLGGGSGINVSTWSRGHQADWDFYASESGNPLWGYSAILELYRSRIENWVGIADPAYRGTNGVVRVQPRQDTHAFSHALMEGAASLGLHQFPNPGGKMMESVGGCSISDETVVEGNRRSIFRSYVYPLMHQSNITVLTDALVTKIVFQRRRATGVELLYRGEPLTVSASRDVVLSLGAIHTPKVLMQSGIGDEEELRKFGIPLRESLPGVGRNLHDHMSFGCVWENTDKPLPSSPRSETVCFWKSSPDLDSPNFFTYAKQGPFVTPENAARLQPPAASWSLVVGMRPNSRGSVRLSGPDSSSPVRIDPNYLSDSRDMADLAKGLATARDIAGSASLKSYRGQELLPGSLNSRDLENFFRNGIGTFWHQSCTAKMGRDAMSVVDDELRVYGVDGLRIADASVLPRVTTGNTMAPCVAVGERAAEFLQKDQFKS